MSSNAGSSRHGHTNSNSSSSGSQHRPRPSTERVSPPRTSYTQFRQNVPCYCLPNWAGECPSNNSCCAHSYWAHTPPQMYNGYVAAAPFCIGCQAHCYSTTPSPPPASTQLRIGYCQPSPPPSPADPQNTRQLMPLAQHSAEHAYHIFVHRFKRMCQQARERRPSIIINDVSTSLRMIPLGQSRRAESLQPAWVSAMAVPARSGQPGQPI
ncbi:hypothetical protein FRB94_008749 [Tulasnella sp. JGI-2019a]|nr:hypothetical protein FRB93_006873 [Tulasnella sp. JGI-2019a]KAG8995833.1 hypothetical protein FRB94_008749 [Tulasnella sp. JGI-2019a]